MNVRVARLTTTALGAACGFLLLVALLQYAGVGRGYGWAADDPSSAPSLPGGGTVDDKPLKLPPASAFAEVEAHPLFNEDRMPTPADASDANATAPLSPLNITLTGIVSTSSVKIAMVQDKARNQSVALKVGMPLEGDQASWTLVEVKPRSVVFRSAANERTEVELETSVAQPPKPAPSHNTGAKAPATAKATATGGANTKDNKRADSGDLAKRIEERRRQMREDAENLRKQGGKGKPPPPPPPPAPPKQ